MGYKRILIRYSIILLLYKKVLYICAKWYGSEWTQRLHQTQLFITSIQNIRMSLAGYRRLLRSINVAFAGDHFAISQAKVQLKSEFYKNKNSSDLESHLRDIEDVDEMLRFHIVQAKKSDKGNFGEHNVMYDLISSKFILMLRFRCKFSREPIRRTPSDHCSRTGSSTRT